MSKTPLFSIIVPVYNTSAYLEQCLDSILNQSYSNYEVIIINDGSTDNSEELIKPFLAESKSFKYLKQENKGLSAARNFGIEHAEGDYLLFLDSDDWYEQNLLDTLQELVSINPYAFVLWDYFKAYANKHIKVKLAPRYGHFNSKETKQFLLDLVCPCSGNMAHPEKLNKYVTVWNKLYKTSIVKINDIRFVDTKIIGTEDTLFNIQYLKFVNEMYVVNKPLIYYRKDNQNSLTSKYKEGAFDKVKNQLKYIRQNLPDYHGVDKRYTTRVSFSLLPIFINECYTSNPKPYFERIKSMKLFSTDELFNSALQKLNLNTLSLKWRLYFYLIKNNNFNAVYFLTYLINLIRGK